MRAALWKLPGDFDEVQSEDHSHQSLNLICHLEASDYGDMKRFDDSSIT